MCESGQQRQSWGRRREAVLLTHLANKTLRDVERRAICLMSGPRVIRSPKLLLKYPNLTCLRPPQSNVQYSLGLQCPNQHMLSLYVIKTFWFLDICIYKSDIYLVLCRDLARTGSFLKNLVFGQTKISVKNFDFFEVITKSSPDKLFF